MSNYAVGTRVQDIATRWTGTVVSTPVGTINGQITTTNEWQHVPPNTPASYNDSLIAVQWDSPFAGLGFVFVSNGSVEPLGD
jgi:hypothetical protein